LRRCGLGREEQRHGVEQRDVGPVDGGVQEGTLEIETPRDRDGTFEPQLVQKRQVRLAGMEEKILALYARGMTTRDIESALVDLYGVTISHGLIAQVTDAVLDEARAWQSRPLESIYPIVWLDGIVVKVQQNKQVIHSATWRQPWAFRACRIDFEWHSEILRSCGRCC
jgi:transposase-like protein